MECGAVGRTWADILRPRLGALLARPASAAPLLLHAFLPSTTIAACPCCLLPRHLRTRLSGASSPAAPPAAPTSAYNSHAVWRLPEPGRTFAFPSAAPSISLHSNIRTAVPYIPPAADSRARDTPWPSCRSRLRSRTRSGQRTIARGWRCCMPSWRRYVKYVLLLRRNDTYVGVVLVGDCGEH